VRAAKVGEDGCDEETAAEFAMCVLDSVMGNGAGIAWRASDYTRSACKNCGDGYDDLAWHRTICPAMGLLELNTGDEVRLANLTRQEFNGREGVLGEFNSAKQRWVVSMGGRDALFKAANLEKMPAKK